MKLKTIYCRECDLEIRIGHEADPDYYPIQFCPVCATAVEDETYEQTEDDDA